MYRACKMNVNTIDKKVIVEITRVCNLNCEHCLYSEFLNTPTLYMPMEKYIEIIETFASKGFSRVVLTGGEPTLHPQLIKMSKYARARGFTVSICTNGVINMDEEMLIAFPFATFTISLDSHIPEVHDLFRGRKGAFKKTILFIEKLKQKGKNVSIHIALGEFNIDRIDETITYALEFSREVVLATVYLKNQNDNIEYQSKLQAVKKRYLLSQEVILVGFAEYCENPDCLYGKNIVFINKDGNSVDCYWKKNGGKIISIDSALTRKVVGIEEN